MSDVSKTNDSGSFGWFCLGFCVPIAGLIYFLIKRGDEPLNTKKALIGAIVSVALAIVAIVMYIILIIMSVFILSSDPYYMY